MPNSRLRPHAPQNRTDGSNVTKRGSPRQRAYDAARRAFFGGDIDAETGGRDGAHYETEIDMLRQELSRMRSAAEERQRQHATAERVNAWANRWADVRDAHHG